MDTTSSTMDEIIKKEELPGPIVVIHPGSRYLRIGRSSDVVPCTILHAIACKRKPIGKIYSDKFLVPFTKLDRQTAVEIEDCRLKASHLLQSSLMSDGSRRFATPCQQISAFNKRCEAIVEDNEIASPWCVSDAEYIIGNDILKLDPKEAYNIHFPYKQGDFNIHDGVGGTKTAVLSYLYKIWMYALSECLGLSEDLIKVHRAVLIIPDIYDRSHIKALTNLLLNDIGFAACFVFQDHAASTFGAGVGAACVVDVGEEKVSVSCVEDAISHLSTRLRLTYGGGDVTQLFHWLLKKSSFPHNFNQNNKADIELLNQLKEDFCHMDLDRCGAQEKIVKVSEPGQLIKKFEVQVGDEVILAPLSLFMSDLLRVTGPKRVIYQSSYVGDPDDPFDENFLRDISRMKNKESLEFSGFETSEVTEEEMMVDEQNRPEHCTHNEEKLLSIDQAILMSIDRCSCEEVKRKMYQTILVVGGGSNFDCFGKWLQDKLALHIPVAFRGDGIEVITRAKDLDPTMTAWKGASLLSGLEGNGELWINKNEWNAYGVKILREKCPFIW